MPKVNRRCSVTPVAVFVHFLFLITWPSSLRGDKSVVRTDEGRRCFAIDIHCMTDYKICHAIARKDIFPQFSRLGLGTKPQYFYEQEARKWGGEGEYLNLGRVQSAVYVGRYCYWWIYLIVLARLWNEKGLHKAPKIGVCVCVERGQGNRQRRGGRILLSCKNRKYSLGKAWL